MDNAVTHHGEVAVLRITTDRGTAKNAQNLKDAIDEQIEKEFRNIVVDMEAMSYVDSNYLGALVTGLKHAIKAGGDLRLVGFQKPVKTMFELTRLYNIFRVYDNVEEAISSFNSGESRS